MRSAASASGYTGKLAGFRPWNLDIKKIRVAPALDCGLTSASVSEDTPYGRAEVAWEWVGGQAIVHVTIPASTTAVVCLPGKEETEVESGRYIFTVSDQ